MNGTDDNSILTKMISPLLDWYDAKRRVLPWRENPKPYYVWVSEIMLQQTRVEAVKSYYERFIRELPDISHLASIQEERLLKLWEGLGYYNRVRNMQKAAIKIMEEYNGKMPETYEELIKLPGIGSYTAGAIASIAYGEAVPAVDGNVLRVLSRLRSDSRNIMELQVKNKITSDLQSIIPKERPGDFNQALMELGAIVCIPNGKPKCSECPWGFTGDSLCIAHREQRETEYPVKPKKKERSIEYKTILIIRDENKTALRKRSNTGLLAGMYEFPSLEGNLSMDEVLKELKIMGIQAISMKPLPESKHIFTHKEWHMVGYAIQTDELADKSDKEQELNYIFADTYKIKKDYPIPTAYKAYMKYISEKDN